jgi:hypothetical protein
MAAAAAGAGAFKAAISVPCSENLRDLSADRA